MQHISLEVPDVKAAYKELLAPGVPDDQKRQPMVGLDRHWLFNLVDKDGTRTELMEIRPVEGPR